MSKPIVTPIKISALWNKICAKHFPSGEPLPNRYSDDTKIAKLKDQYSGEPIYRRRMDGRVHGVTKGEIFSSIADKIRERSYVTKNYGRARQEVLRQYSHLTYYSQRDAEKLGWFESSSDAVNNTDNRQYHNESRHYDNRQYSNSKTIDNSKNYSLPHDSADMIESRPMKNITPKKENKKKRLPPGTIDIEIY